MGIGDWLFRKKQQQNNVSEVARMMQEYDASPLPEGKLNTDTGEVTCPHCSYVLSLIEAIQGRSLGAVGVYDCPKCGKTFKQH